MDIPDEILQEAEEAISKLLPEKSRDRYEKELKTFNEWRNAKAVRRDQYMPVIEQLGSYDPMPNQFNEKLVSLNIERIRHWIGNGAICSKPVEQLFGLSGLFPIHPSTYISAWRNRQLLEAQEQENSKEKSEAAASN